ncbi:MAG: hypothetical protein GX117_13210 [Candidatus Hydrogenedentes bacterium]|nr:hypothetical protein [Candidatus Hydrogenedentota bacterium]
MGFLDNLVKAASRSMGMGQASLKSAYLDEAAPTGPGVYQILYRGQLMKVGKAEDGLRKRFSDYYRGVKGGTAGLKYITEDNRDEVKVKWRECSRNDARKFETTLYDQAVQRGEEMPWSERR